MSPRHSLRGFTLLSYLCMGASSAFTFMEPLRSLREVDLLIWIYTWAATLVLGGLLGVIAAIRRSIVLELLGLVLLMTAYTVLSVAIVFRLVDGSSRSPAGSMFFLATLLALLLYLVRRFVELWILVRTPPQPPGGASS